MYINRRNSFMKLMEKLIREKRVHVAKPQKGFTKQTYCSICSYTWNPVYQHSVKDYSSACGIEPHQPRSKHLQDHLQLNLEAILLQPPRHLQWDIPNRPKSETLNMYDIFFQDKSCLTSVPILSLSSHICQSHSNYTYQGNTAKISQTLTRSPPYSSNYKNGRMHIWTEALLEQLLIAGISLRQISTRWEI